jgi:8-oxo-dGTP diphosphatase
VLATPARPLEPADLRLDEESSGVGWFPVDGLPEVPLHPGLAASLPVLRPLLSRAPTGR